MTPSDQDLSKKIIDFLQYIGSYKQDALGYIYSSTRNVEINGIAPEHRKRIQNNVDKAVARLLVIFIFSTFEEFFDEKQRKRIEALVDKNDSDKLKAYYHLRHSFAHMLSGRARTGKSEFDALMDNESARPRGVMLENGEIVADTVFAIDLVDYMTDITKRALVRLHSPSQGL